ncbi:Amine oxidase [flavin-containing] A [Lamellibrachia satsuma]|nr:Amine oxidase [flavin-containing] A [Lamellibrachia satsuma]
MRIVHHVIFRRGEMESSSVGDAHSFTVDVVIIGAGLSGLTAAHQLWKKDPSLHVAVLEAKGRVGGRMVGQTLQAATGTDVWDMGGQWVGSCQPQVMALLQELDLPTYNQYTHGKKLMQIGPDMKIRSYTSDIPTLSWLALIDLHFFIVKIEKMMLQVPVDDPGLCEHAAEWDSVTMATVKERYLWTTEAKETVDAALRVIFGSDPSHISLLYLLMYARAAGGFTPLISDKANVGGQEFKVKGGAFQICEKLAVLMKKQLLHLNEPVARVEQLKDDVRVTTLKGRQYVCKRLILAVPPQQAARIVYEPPLPAQTMHVLQRMPAGCMTKVIITYQHAFWREDGYCGAVVTNGGQSIHSDCDHGPLSIVYDATSSGGNPALVAFIAGEQQLEYSLKTPEERKKAVLWSMSEFFGTLALDCIDYAEKNWGEEAYNGGCPVSVGVPGMMTHFAPALRKPFNRIHFAGTESATVWCGFLNGAVQAGYRAANEVLYNLRPQVISARDLEGTTYTTKHAARAVRAYPSAWQQLMQWTLRIGIALTALVFARRLTNRSL